MAARSHSRGWSIVYKAGRWIYEDNNTPITEERPCKSCGQLPVAINIRGRVVMADACIADLIRKLNNVGLLTEYSCCGHGVKSGNIGLRRYCDV